MKNPFDNHAFTLTELLVVIACVAILAGVWLPALAMDSTQSKAVVCRSNLKQIGTATLMYAGDNQDKFPADKRLPSPAGPSYMTNSGAWPTALLNYMGQKSAWVAGMPQPKAYLCPAVTTPGDANMYFVVHYMANAHVIRETDTSDSSMRTPLKSTAIPSPASILLFGEKEPGDWDHNRTANEMKQNAIGKWAQVPMSVDAKSLTRHDGNSDMVAVDGHVALIKFPPLGAIPTNLRELGDVRTGGGGYWANSGSEVIFMRENGATQGGF